MVAPRGSSSPLGAPVPGAGRALGWLPALLLPSPVELLVILALVLLVFVLVRRSR